jgi:hypothetical protein
MSVRDEIHKHCYRSIGESINKYLRSEIDLHLGNNIIQTSVLNHGELIVQSSCFSSLRNILIKTYQYDFS